MFCENCGAKIPDTAKFCRFCGAPQNPIDLTVIDHSSSTVEPPKSKQTSDTVDKEALIEYLDALYKAEMGVIWSDEMIESIKAEKEAGIKHHREAWEPKQFHEYYPVCRQYIAEAKKTVSEAEKEIHYYQNLIEGKPGNDWDYYHSTPSKTPVDKLTDIYLTFIDKQGRESRKFFKEKKRRLDKSA